MSGLLRQTGVVPNDSRDDRIAELEALKGRVGVHELLLPDERMRTDLGNPALTVDALRRDTVTRLHMVTMYWDGVLKVRSGVTSCDELMGHVRRREGYVAAPWLRLCTPPGHG
jgi:hypothetical protein